MSLATAEGVRLARTAVSFHKRWISSAQSNSQQLTSRAHRSPACSLKTGVSASFIALPATRQGSRANAPILQPSTFVTQVAARVSS